MAEIRFLPVCSNCGTVLKYREIEFREEEFDGFNAICFGGKVGKISPDSCPICDCRFEQIIVPTRLPFCYKGADE